MKLNKVTGSGEAFEGDLFFGAQPGDTFAYSFKDLEWHHIVSIYDNSIRTIYTDGRKESTSVKITTALRTQLLASAQEDFNKAQKAYNEASQVLTWARSLVVGGELVAPTVTVPASTPITLSFAKNVRTRYFVQSKSGLTKGHYIQRFSDRTVDCSCPGFINRGYCWATNKAKANTYAFPQWNRSADLFNKNRQLAYNVNL